MICCHGGPGEDGTLQAALDLAGIRYSGSDARPGPPSGWTSWPSRAWWPTPACPSLPRVLLSARGRAAWPFAGPLHREAPLRRFVHRDRDGRGLGHGRGPARGQPPSPRRGGGRALPARPLRPEHRRPALARTARALGHGEAAPVARPGPRSSTTATSTSPARGWPARPGSSRPGSLRARRTPCGGGRPGWPGWPSSGGWPGSTSSPTAEACS